MERELSPSPNLSLEFVDDLKPLQSERLVAYTGFL